MPDPEEKDGPTFEEELDPTTVKLKEDLTAAGKDLGEIIKVVAAHFEVEEEKVKLILEHTASTIFTHVHESLDGFAKTIHNAAEARGLTAGRFSLKALENSLLHKE